MSAQLLHMPWPLAGAPRPWGAAPAGPFGQMAHALLRVPQLEGRARRRLLAGPQPVEASAWLDVLSREARERVLAAVRVRELPAGMVLGEPGQAIEGWQAVLSGLVKIERADDGVSGVLSGRFDTGMTLGCWFGEEWLAAGEPVDARISTCQETLLALLPAALFHELLEREAGLARHVARLQAQRTLALRRRLRWPRRMSTNTRVALQLAGLFELSQADGPGADLPLTQVALSQFLGLSRQRTNEALGVMRQAGCISLAYGGVQVVDPADLARRALQGRFD